MKWEKNVTKSKLGKKHLHQLVFESSITAHIVSLNHLSHTEVEELYHSMSDTDSRSI